MFIIANDYIMTVAIDDDDSEYRFTLRPVQSRRIVSQKLAEVEFADDVALKTDTIEGAEALLDRLEIAAKYVGLVINCSMTKFITLNIPKEEISVVSSTGNQLQNVNDFVYFGAWIATTERDPRAGELKHGWLAMSLKRCRSQA